ncbi:hypothetical protein [Saccharicrinis sp. FJH54]|uniref:hypothetical protein n=1 Tax=Saccharicrinis sp. FJH54 TaxID=3344665 RepID=UPI0035D4C309
MNLGKILKNVLFNPFFTYALFVSLSLVFYSFGWSNFPNLSFPVLLLILGSAIISFLLGLKVRYFKSESENKLKPEKFWFFSVVAGIILTLGFIALYINGGVPMYNILFSGNTYNYQDFKGINYLSTITMYGMSSLICLWINAVYIFRDKKYLFLIGIGLLHVALMASRGYTVLVLFPGVLIVLYYLKLDVRKLISLIVLGIVFFYLFGRFGDSREEAKKRDGSFNFYSIYQNNSYPDFLPDEFFWGYYYFTSPIAKMQYTVQDKQINALKNDYGALVLFEMMPYSFGERFNKYLNYNKRVSSYKLPPWFVGTAFYGPYLYAKWSGVLIYTVFLFSLVYLIFLFTKQKLGKWGIPVIANLSLYMALSVFDNMIAFAPINFQLAGCLVFGVVVIRLKI